MLALLEKKRKKGLILAFCALFFSCTCFAQDIIVTKDSKRINAKVTRVNEDDVRYKDFNDQNGPTHSILKSNIASILYEDGQVETFGPATTQPQPQQSQPQPQQRQQPQPQPQKTVTSNYTQPTTSQPQQETAAPKKYRWGVKGGLNSASEYTSKASTNSRWGVHVGVLMEATLSNKVDIQPELVYSMQGCVDADEMMDKFDYINLPIMFKIYVNQSRTFSIDVGPQFGYMVSASVSYKGNSLNVYNLITDLNKFDASICVGVSYKLNEKFYISLRYNYGVTKIASSLENQNAVAQLGVGYIF